MSVCIASRACKSQVSFLLLVCALLFPAEAAAAAPAKVCAERYEIDVSFQPEKGFLHARASVTLRAVQELEAIEFELNPNLKILDVRGPEGRRLDFARSQRLGSPKLSVRLAESLAAKQETTLIFTYEGALPPKSLDYITKDGILLRDESRWYPAVDLSAFTQNDIRITVPSTWNAFTSGQAQGSIDAGLSTTFRWKTSPPVSSRSIVALPGQPENCVPTPLDSSGSSNLQPPSTCFAGSHQEAGKRMAARARELLQRYSTAFGAYPQASLIIVQGFPGKRGAIGYSAPGLLVVSEDAVRFQDYPGYAPGFLPHEIAHQWFPIEVTLASEDDGWLAESLAEYLAWRYLSEKDPGQARRMVERAMRDALAAEPLRPLSLGLHLFALENWDVTHETLYQRGMLVFRTLETVIDRERVDLALRQYHNRYAGKTASIADFRKTCEEISGRNLGWFFDYFIQGTRIPEIELHRAPATAPGEVSGDIVLKNVPVEFTVRVEMRLETSVGPVEHSVATRGLVTPFTATTTEPVMRITVDPDQRILHWTEAARRNRSQRVLLWRVREFESEGEFTRAAEACQKALAADPENLASNEQHIRFELGRLHYRQGHFTAAYAEFGRVLALGSLDPMESDFNRAWSRVYRARIERGRGHLAAAHAEVLAGLAMKAPALEAQVILPEAPERVSTAAAELRALSH